MTQRSVTNYTLMPYWSATTVSRSPRCNSVSGGGASSTTGLLVPDAAVLRHYHDHRPNPLMPADLPTVGEEHLNG